MIKIKLTAAEDIECDQFIKINPNKFLVMKCIDENFSIAGVAKRDIKKDEVVEYNPMYGTNDIGLENEK